jgi:hypothetical protein
MELVDVGDEFSTGYVLRRALRTGESAGDLIAQVGRSIDRIFYGHLRSDLRQYRLTDESDLA